MFQQTSNAALELCRASCGYGKIAVLSDVSIKVSLGELVVVTGPNGCGKSTLLRAIVNQADILSGSVSVFGASMRECRRFALERVIREFKIGYLPQLNRGIGSLSVMENLELAAWRLPSRMRRREAVHALVQDREFLSMKELLGKPAGSLSGGQRLMLSMAMLKLGGSRLYLLDEPLAGIDRERRSSLAQLIRKFCETSAVVAIEHDPVLMEIADRVHWLGKAVSGEA